MFISRVTKDRSSSRYGSRQNSRALFRDSRRLRRNGIGVCGSNGVLLDSFLIRYDRGSVTTMPRLCLFGPLILKGSLVEAAILGIHPNDDGLRSTF
jgi:hypothetical protein